MRRLVAALLLLNLALLGWLVLSSRSDQDEREPLRLQQQVHPEQVRVLSSSEDSADTAQGVTPDTQAEGASAVPAGMGASTAAGGLGAVKGAVTALNAVCLEAGPFSEDELPAAEAALAAALPPGTWRRQTLKPAAAYLVYLGRFQDQRTAERRLQEVRQRGLQAELARELPALEPGLVFSRHPQQAQAEAALAELQAARGPRLARVVPTSEATAVLLRVERPTDDVRGRIAGLEPTPALRGGFRGCGKSEG